MVQGNLTLPRCGLKAGLGHASGNPFQNQRKSPIKASQEKSIWTIETEQDRQREVLEDCLVQMLKMDQLVLLRTEKMQTQPKESFQSLSKFCSETSTK